MEIHNLVLGDYQTNCYCVRTDAQSHNCVIIDTGLDAQPLIEYLKTNHLNPAAVVFTHGHADHIAGVKLLRGNFPDIKVAIHRDDAKMLTNPVRNLSIIAGAIFKTEPANIIIDNEGPCDFAGIHFEILHTPGHTAGGICLYNQADKVVFVGDTLFAGSIGRTDFPSGNFNRLVENIKTKLLALPDETRVFPGHGPATTIRQERLYNQYLY